jgi:hypothetical protein
MSGIDGVEKARIDFDMSLEIYAYASEALVNVLFLVLRLIVLDENMMAIKVL